MTDATASIPVGFDRPRRASWWATYLSTGESFEVTWRLLWRDIKNGATTVRDAIIELFVRLFTEIRTGVEEFSLGTWHFLCQKYDQLITICAWLVQCIHAINARSSLLARLCWARFVANLRICASAFWTVSKVAIKLVIAIVGTDIYLTEKPFDAFPTRLSSLELFEVFYYDDWRWSEAWACLGRICALHGRINRSTLATSFLCLLLFTGTPEALHSSRAVQLLLLSSATYVVLGGIYPVIWRFCNEIRNGVPPILRSPELTSFWRALAWFLLTAVLFAGLCCVSMVYKDTDTEETAPVEDEKADKESTDKDLPSPAQDKEPRNSFRQPDDDNSDDDESDDDKPEAPPAPKGQQRIYSVSVSPGGMPPAGRHGTLHTVLDGPHHASDVNEWPGFPRRSPNSSHPAGRTPYQAYYESVAVDESREGHGDSSANVPDSSIRPAPVNGSLEPASRTSLPDHPESSRPRNQPNEPATVVMRRSSSLVEAMAAIKTMIAALLSRPGPQPAPIPSPTSPVPLRSALKTDNLPLSPSRIRRVRFEASLPPFSVSPTDTTTSPSNPSSMAWSPIVPTNVPPHTNQELLTAQNEFQYVQRRLFVLLAQTNVTQQSYAQWRGRVTEVADHLSHSLYANLREFGTREDLSDPERELTQRLIQQVETLMRDSDQRYSAIIATLESEARDAESTRFSEQYASEQGRRNAHIYLGARLENHDSRPDNGGGSRRAT